MEMELNGLLPFHSLISSMVSGCWLCLLGPSNSSPFPLPFPFSNNSLRLSLFAGAKKRKGKADGMEQLLKQLWNGVRLRRGLVPSHNPLFHKEKSRTNQQIKSIPQLNCRCFIEFDLLKSLPRSGAAWFAAQFTHSLREIH